MRYQTTDESIARIERSVKLADEILIRKTQLGGDIFAAIGEARQLFLDSETVEDQQLYGDALKELFDALDVFESGSRETFNADMRNLAASSPLKQASRQVLTNLAIYGRGLAPAPVQLDPER